MRTAPWRVFLGAVLLVCILPYVVTRVSLEFFKVSDAPSAMWWPATGLALVIVVRCPRRWWWVLLAVFGIATGLAKLPSGGLSVTLIYAVVNVLEVLVAASILQGGVRPNLLKLRIPQDAARFVIAIAVAVAIGAILVALRSATFPGDTPWYQVSRGFVTTHLLSLLTLAPLLLPGSAWWKAGLVQNLEFFVVLVATIAVDSWVFFQPLDGGRAFPVLLPIVWAGIRLDPLRATIVSLFTCASAAYSTSRALGTFTNIDDVYQRQLVTQGLIATVAITTLALVLITRHRAQLAAQVKDSEQTLRIALQDALVGLYSIRLDAGRVGEIRNVNTALSLMLGYELAELNGRPASILWSTADAAESVAVYARIEQLASGAIDGFQREARLMTASGDELWVELSATRVVPSVAPPFALIYVHDLTGREENKKLLESIAMHDALTGLPNRSVLFPRLEDLLRRARYDGTQVGLLYLDLNGFKSVNDTHGHSAGDAVLVEVARRLEDSARAGDTVARLGGDEFAVLAASITSDHDLAFITDRIHRSLTKPILLPDGESVTIGTSIGSAVGKADATADDLVQAADVEMYRVKHGSGVPGPRQTRPGVSDSMAISTSRF